MALRLLATHFPALTLPTPADPVVSAPGELGSPVAGDLARA